MSALFWTLRTKVPAADTALGYRVIVAFVMAPDLDAAVLALGADRFAVKRCTTPKLIGVAQGQAMGRPWEALIDQTPSAYDRFIEARSTGAEMRDEGFDIS